MRGGNNPKDLELKNNGFLTINQMCNSMNRKRCFIQTALTYLNIQPSQIIGTHKFYKETDLNKIKELYESHKDNYNKFITSEMRKLKNGGNGYTTKRSDKIKQTCKERYGDNWKEELTSRRNKSIEEKYGDKNYRNIKKSNDTRNKNRELFCKENDCTEFSKIFNSNIEHSWSTLHYYLNKLNINLISHKSVLYIKNKDCELLKSEIDKCSKEYHISNEEKEVLEFVLSNFNDVVKYNDRTILNGKELDIYIPSKKVAIEFDGLYYHSELFVDKNYHLNKTLECEKQGIRLIHIFEDEWINKKEICESIILSSLGIYERKIFARKCEIREIPTDEYKIFLNDNHLQGYTLTKHKIGLYYNNELVQCIGLSSSRFTKNEIELVRLCTKKNTQVIGGFSKLMKNYCSNYNVNEIISYVDRRVFNGIGYKGCGFETIGYSKPSYQMIHNMSRFNRMSFQKKYIKEKLNNYNESLSEHQNCLNNKLYRIYDCGTIKVKYTYRKNKIPL